MKLNDYLCAEFNPPQRIIVTPRELAKLVGLPTALLILIQKPHHAQIAVKHEADGLYSESMDFEPAESGNFWLKVSLEKGEETTPLMGLKFSVVSKDRLEISSPYLRTLTPGTDLYVRPALRHEAIENVEGLICKAAGIALKPYPARDRSFRPVIAPLFL